MFRHFSLFVLLLLSSLTLHAQEEDKEDTTPVGETSTFVPLVKVSETTLGGEPAQMVELNRLYIYPEKVYKNEKERLKQDRLVYNIKKVLPIAKEVRGIVIETYEVVSLIKDKKEQKKHLKQVEKDLKASYTPRMKKLTLRQGKLLIKLVNRETGSSGYGLLRAFLGDIRAGFYQAFAWTFGASLAKKYDPENNEEDKETERIVRQVEAGQI